MTKHFNEDLDDKVLRKKEKNLEEKTIELTESEFIRSIDTAIGSINKQIQQYNQLEYNLQNLYKQSILYKSDSNVKYFYDVDNEGFYIKHTKKDKIGF